MDWWLWGAIACELGLLYCLYRVLRLPAAAVLDTPVILSTRVFLMADVVQIGTTLKSPTGAPADGSVPNYRCTIIVGANAPASNDLPIGQAPGEIVVDPNTQVTVTFAPIGVGGAVGPDSTPLVFVAEVPPPTAKLDQPQIASQRVIVTPAAPPA